jgi:hypothetical protein
MVGLPTLWVRREDFVEEVTADIKLKDNQSRMRKRKRSTHLQRKY